MSPSRGLRQQPVGAPAGRRSRRWDHHLGELGWRTPQTGEVHDLVVGAVEGPAKEGSSSPWPARCSAPPPFPSSGSPGPGAPPPPPPGSVRAPPRAPAPDAPPGWSPVPPHLVQIQRLLPGSLRHPPARPPDSRSARQRGEGRVRWPSARTVATRGQCPGVRDPASGVGCGAPPRWPPPAPASRRQLRQPRSGGIPNFAWLPPVTTFSWCPFPHPGSTRTMISRPAKSFPPVLQRVQRIQGDPYPPLQRARVTPPGWGEVGGWEDHLSRGSRAGEEGEDPDPAPLRRHTPARPRPPSPAGGSPDGHWPSWRRRTRERGRSAPSRVSSCRSTVSRSYT